MEREEHKDKYSYWELQLTEYLYPPHPKSHIGLVCFDLVWFHLVQFGFKRMYMVSEA